MSTLTSSRELTIQDRILVAACQITGGLDDLFSVEKLVVSAWTEYPEVFGLRTYENQYPDSNKVTAYIMGERGLVKRGLLVRACKGNYRVSAAGRQKVDDLQDAATENIPPKSSYIIYKDLGGNDRFLSKLFESDAYKLFSVSSGRDKVDFHKALDFWDMSNNLTSDEITVHLSNVDVTLNEVDRVLEFGKAKLSTGKVISAGDVRVLRNIHDYLKNQYSTVLKIMGKVVKYEIME